MGSGWSRLLSQPLVSWKHLLINVLIALFLHTPRATCVFWGTGTGSFFGKLWNSSTSWSQMTNIKLTCQGFDFSSLHYEGRRNTGGILGFFIPLTLQSKMCHCPISQRKGSRLVYKPSQMKTLHALQAKCRDLLRLASKWLQVKTPDDGWDRRWPCTVTDSGVYRLFSTSFKTVCTDCSKVCSIWHSHS